MKATAVPSLAERAIQFYGDEASVYEKLRVVQKQREQSADGNRNVKGGDDAVVVESTHTDKSSKVEECGDSRNAIKETRYGIDIK